MQREGAPLAWPLVRPLAAPLRRPLFAERAPLFMEMGSCFWLALPLLEASAFSAFSLASSSLMSSLNEAVGWSSAANVEHPELTPASQFPALRRA